MWKQWWNPKYGGGGAWSCLILWTPSTIAWPGSSIHGILQARILEWVATSSSRGSSWLRNQTHIACISYIGRWILYHCTTWEAQVSIESERCSVVSHSLRLHGLYSPWNSSGQNTGGGSLSLLQGIFPTQGSNPGLLHCRQILYQLTHKESPRILEWVAYPFSSEPSDPGMELGSPAWQVDSLPTELSGKPSKCWVGQKVH